MAAVLALDIATTTGWALQRASGRVESGRLMLKAGAHAGDRMLQFRAFLVDINSRLEREGGISTVVWEDAFRQPGNANALHHRLVGVLLEWAAKNGVAVQPAGVSAIKKHATGNGNADKEAMLAAARALFPGVRDHNEADAIHVLRFATTSGLKVAA